MNKKSYEYKYYVKYMDMNYQLCEVCCNQLTEAIGVFNFVPDKFSPVLFRVRCN